jgi:hypothetical protein
MFLSTLYYEQNVICKAIYVYLIDMSYFILYYLIFILLIYLRISKLHERVTINYKTT